MSKLFYRYNGLYSPTSQMARQAHKKGIQKNNSIYIKEQTKRQRAKKETSQLKKLDNGKTEISVLRARENSLVASCAPIR